MPSKFPATFPRRCPVRSRIESSAFPRNRQEPTNGTSIQRSLGAASSACQKVAGSHQEGLACTPRELRVRKVRHPAERQSARLAMAADTGQGKQPARPDRAPDDFRGLGKPLVRAAVPAGSRVSARAIICSLRTSVSSVVSPPTQATAVAWQSETRYRQTPPPERTAQWTSPSRLLRGQARGTRGV